MKRPGSSSLLVHSLVTIYFGFLVLVFSLSKESSQEFVASFVIIPSSRSLSHTDLFSAGDRSKLTLPRREGSNEVPLLVRKNNLFNFLKYTSKTSLESCVCLKAKRKNNNASTKKKKKTEKQLEKLLKEAELSEGGNNDNLTKNTNIDPSILKDANVENGVFEMKQANEEDKGEKEGPSDEMLDKLRAEATTPFRTIRLFIYGTFAFGASIGSLTAFTQLLASANNQPDALPLNQALQNVGIDVTVVVASLGAFLFENKLAQATKENVAKQYRRKEGGLSQEEEEKREKFMRDLSVTIRVGEKETDIKEANVGDLTKKANQHIVLVAGPQEFLNEALVSARLSKQDTFIKGNAMIVPLLCTANNRKSGKGSKDNENSNDVISNIVESKLQEKKGFSDGKEEFLLQKTKQLFAKEAYVANPEVNKNQWLELAEKEFRDAEGQGNKKVRKEGVTIVMRKDGYIVRRGLGVPEWKDLVKYLDSKEINMVNTRYSAAMPTAKK